MLSVVHQPDTRLNMKVKPAPTVLAKKFFFFKFSIFIKLDRHPRRFNRRRSCCQCLSETGIS